MAPADPVDSAQLRPLEKVSDQVPTAILRAAKGFIATSQLEADWEKVPLSLIPTRGSADVPVLPCRVSRRFTDPVSGRSNAIKISIEPGYDEDESVRVLLDMEHEPDNGNLRASLSDAETGTLRASVPLARLRTDLERHLPYGFYHIEIKKDGTPLLDFKFVIEPFSLPEAMQSAQEYVLNSEYSKALAVLDYAAERYPKSADVRDLLCAVHGLIACDPESYERERSQFAKTRHGLADPAVHASQVFRSSRSDFGDRAAMLIAGKAMDPASVADGALADSHKGDFSTAVLQSLMLLKDKLEINPTPQNESLLRVLRVIADRSKQRDTITGALSDQIEAVKSNTQTSDDEKFVLSNNLLDEYTAALAASRVAEPDYTPFFEERIGRPCWDWLGMDIRRVINTAEDLYHYQAGKSRQNPGDFTPAILENCRGLEDLLNKKLGAYCRTIQEAVIDKPNCADAALEHFTEETVEEGIKRDRSMSMWKVGFLMRLGRILHPLRPDLFGPGLASLLSRTPGLGDVDQYVLLNYIVSELRNGKAHSARYTSVLGMQLARKLILGIDEAAVGYGSVWEWLQGSRFKKDGAEVYKRVSDLWPKYPGIVPLLWQSFENATAQTTAA